MDFDPCSTRCPTPHRTLVFDAAFDTVLDALAGATGCDREALDKLLETVPPSAGLSPEGLVDRIVATDLLAQAALAVQARDLAAFGAVREAEEVADGEPLTDRGGTAGIEIGLALNVAAVTGQHRIHEATCAVVDHPQLLGLVGTGAVSMSGLRRVCAATDVLEPDQRRTVDRRLAADAARFRLTPGQLEEAALCRVLEVDPAAADKRTARARRKGRCVRLGDPVDGLGGIFARLRAEESLAVFRRLDRTARGMRRDGDERSLDQLMADLFTEWLTGTALVRTDPRDGSVEPPVWRSRDGFEPWLWSEPPPRHPDDDPPLNDPAWDRYLDFTTGAAGPGDSAGAAATTSTRRPVDRNGEQSAGPGSDDGTGEHPAHAPPEGGSEWRLPVRVEVQVAISAATLLGLDQAPGLLRGYGAVPGWVIHDLVETAGGTGARTTWRGLFCDPVDGRLVAMDSTARFFTGALRDFAVYRDQQCRLTGGRLVEVDHVVEHRYGGPTSAANGQGLGKLAHVVKDHPVISVTALPPDEFGDGLDGFRINAPDIEWTMPTGHRYNCELPPALGPGSQPDHTDQPASVMEQHLARLLAEQS